MNKEPETFEELIRKKRCIELTNYYDLSMEELEQIYNFLAENENGEVKCGDNTIQLLVNGTLNNGNIIMTRCISSAIDGINMTNKIFNIIPHYTSSSGGYSGGNERT